MIHKLLAAVMVLACACTTFGQSIQSQAQSIIGRTQAAVSQTTAKATSAVGQTKAAATNAWNRGSSMTNVAKQQIANPARTTQPSQARIQQLPATDQYSQSYGTINQNSQQQYGNRVYQSNQQVMNPVNASTINQQPIATTTPHDTNAGANFTPQNFTSQNFGQTQPQYYPTQYQSQPTYNYNNNSGSFFGNRQFQPVRRVWNFTKGFVPFGR